MDDGQTIEIPPGSAYEIPPGTTRASSGDEAWVTLEWTSANIVGVDQVGGGERVLATVLFTDIVDSTGTLGADRRRGMARPPHRAQPARCATSSTGFADARSTRPAMASWRSSIVPRGRSRAALAMTSRRAAMGMSIRVGHPYRRGRVRGRQRPGRCGPCRRAGAAKAGRRRGARVIDDAGPPRGLGADPRRRRDARAQGPGGVADALSGQGDAPWNELAREAEAVDGDRRSARRRQVADRDGVGTACQADREQQDTIVDDGRPPLFRGTPCR